MRSVKIAQLSRVTAFEGLKQAIVYAALEIVDIKTSALSHDVNARLMPIAADGQPQPLLLATKSNRCFSTGYHCKNIISKELKETVFVLPVFADKQD